MRNSSKTGSRHDQRNSSHLLQDIHDRSGPRSSPQPTHKVCGGHYRTVCVRGLPPRSKGEDVAELFRNYSITSIRSIPYRSSSSTGSNELTWFVDFADGVNFRRALELDRSKPGLRVNAATALDTEVRPSTDLDRDRQNNEDHNRDKDRKRKRYMSPSQEGRSPTRRKRSRQQCQNRSGRDGDQERERDRDRNRDSNRERDRDCNRDGDHRRDSSLDHVKEYRSLDDRDRGHAQKRRSDGNVEECGRGRNPDWIWSATSVTPYMTATDTNVTDKNITRDRRRVARTPRPLTDLEQLAEVDRFIDSGLARELTVVITDLPLVDCREIAMREVYNAISRGPIRVRYVHPAGRFCGACFVVLKDRRSYSAALAMRTISFHNRNVNICALERPYTVHFCKLLVVFDMENVARDIRQDYGIEGLRLSVPMHEKAYFEVADWNMVLRVLALDGYYHSGSGRQIAVQYVPSPKKRGISR